MSSTLPPALKFFEGSIGGEFFSRLLRASHCRACASLHLQNPTFLDVLCHPSFRTFLLEVFAVCGLRGVIGDVDPFSRRLESFQFDDVAVRTLSLEVRCDILCQLRFVLNGIASAFFQERQSHGRRFRVRLDGVDIKWHEKVIPLFTIDGLRFADVFRHPLFVAFVSSIGGEAHGIDGAVSCYVGPTFFHFMSSFISWGNETEHVEALRIFDELDKSCLPDSVTIPFSQIRHHSAGSAAYTFRKCNDTSWSISSDDYGLSHPVFQFLLDCYRKGPLFRENLDDDIGAPES